MKKNFATVALALLAASAISIGCGDDDDSSNDNGGAGGAGGSAGASSAGKGGATGTSGSGTGGSNKAGTSNGGTSNGGTSNGGTSNGGTSNGGKAGSETGGKGGASGAGGAAGEDVGGAPMGGVESGGAAGDAGAGGAGGAESIYTAEMIARGTLIVRNMALCGGCHTATGGQELGGNPQFKGGALPAPNLTPDATGIGNWSDAQIITAFRDGVDDVGRHLDPAMPYWLFHNMSDDDALDVVAFLRSLPPKSGAVGDANPEAGTHPTPLSPSSFPDSSLQAADAGYAEAQMGKYLVSGVAQCVKCHSPSTAGLPSGSFFSGATPPNNTTIFAPNLTPDATGLSGWNAADVATALKAGTNKAGATLCGSMPAAAKGYGGMTDADAHAIGVYLTTIPAVANAASDPTLEPACP